MKVLKLTLLMLPFFCSVTMGKEPVAIPASRSKIAEAGLGENIANHFGGKASEEVGLVASRLIASKSKLTAAALCKVLEYPNSMYLLEVEGMKCLLVRFIRNPKEEGYATVIFPIEGMASKKEGFVEGSGELDPYGLLCLRMMDNHNLSNERPIRGRFFGDASFFASELGSFDVSKGEKVFYGAANGDFLTVDEGFAFAWLVLETSERLILKVKPEKLLSHYLQCLIDRGEFDSRSSLALVTVEKSKGLGLDPKRSSE